MPPMTAPMTAPIAAGADRGASSAEMAGYAAVMLAALLIAVQAAAWGLAELACRHAANHALQAARVHGGGAAAGRADAAAVLGQIGGGLVADPDIEASRGAAAATVRVAGTAPRVVPFLRLPVGATLSGPVEALTAGEAGRP
jgi:hypothetical protein